MTKKKEEKILEILRSGDFTIAYSEYNDATLYKGKFESYEDCKGKGYDLEGWAEGYEDVVACWLAKALGGNMVTI